MGSLVNYCRARKRVFLVFRFMAVTLAAWSLIVAFGGMCSCLPIPMAVAVTAWSTIVVPGSVCPHLPVHGSHGGGLVTYCRVRKLVQRRCRFSACRRPKRNLKNPVALMGFAYLHRGRGRKRLIQGRCRFAACRRPQAQPEKSCCVDGLCHLHGPRRKERDSSVQGPVALVAGTSSVWHIPLFGSSASLAVA